MLLGMIYFRMNKKIYMYIITYMCDYVKDTIYLLDKIKSLHIPIPSIFENTFCMKLYMSLKKILRTLLKDPIEQKINIKPYTVEKHIYIESIGFLSSKIRSEIEEKIHYAYEYTFYHTTIIYYSSKPIQKCPSFIIRMIYIIQLIQQLFEKKGYAQKVIFLVLVKKNDFPVFQNKSLDQMKLTVVLLMYKNIHVETLYYFEKKK